jgi:poly-gamma-glutamate synthesis protein (capsule biosynthesis protein)
MCHAEQLNAARNADGEHDFNYVFKAIAPYIQSADYSIGNLETTLVRNNYAGWPLFRSPKAFAEALLNAGFDMVTTGNNHSFDAGVSGVRSTIEILNEVGIAFTGTYLTPECRDEITVFEVNGFTFAIVNMTMHKNAICLGENNYMVKVIYLDLVAQATIDYDLIRETMARARALETDFIIASPHLGIEYYGTMNRQGAGHRNDTFERSDTRWHNWVRTLQLFLDEGADMVMNHHPHTLLPAEFVYVPNDDGGHRRAFMAYSMANFVSGQRTVPRETGAVFYVDVTRDEHGDAYISGASYVPVWVRQHDPTREQLCFSVLPVSDTLRRTAGGATPDLRPQDIERLRVVHNDVTHLLSGEPIPLSEINCEYPITRRRYRDEYPGLPLWGTLPWR